MPTRVTEAAVTAIANTANNELKPAIHPDHSNPNYDWLHNDVARIMKRLGPSWAKAKAMAEVDMYKLQQHPLCQGAGLNHCMSLQEQCIGFYNLLARARTIMSVQGVLSIEELATCNDNTEELWRLHKKFYDVVRPLGQLAGQAI